MAYYQITSSTTGKCLERLVEDQYDAQGNIVTNVLGNWQPCQRRHVGVGGRTGGNSGKDYLAMPKKRVMQSEEEEKSERTNILLIGVIVIFFGIILYKLN